MTRMNYTRLPRLLKSVHTAQKKWRKQNYDKSICDFNKEIEEILEVLNLYCKWQTKFKHGNIADKMIPEIFMDGLNGLSFAMFGLYKYANICLRSQLETALRLIYFMDHQREYQWWLDDNEWYRKQVPNYVWGDDFSYFIQIENINKFDEGCPAIKRIFSGKKSGNLLKNIYGKLSKSIHTSAQHFQTSTGKYSPKYIKPKMSEWITNCKDIQRFIIISLILSFPNEFKSLNPSERQTILTKGVVDQDYINKISSTI